MVDGAFTDEVMAGGTASAAVTGSTAVADSAEEKASMMEEDSAAARAFTVEASKEGTDLTAAAIVAEVASAAVPAADSVAAPAAGSAVVAVVGSAVALAVADSTAVAVDIPAEAMAVDTARPGSRRLNRRGRRSKTPAFSFRD
jgi:hypothetical protein